MAQSKSRLTRWRLNFNFRSGQVRNEKIRATGVAGVIIEQVAINASNEMWDHLKERAEKQLGIDAFREISNAAQRYKQLIIGISGDRVGAMGRLKSASVPADGVKPPTYNLSGGPAGRWAPRSTKYLDRKKLAPPKGVGHKRWFDYHGVLSATMGAGKTWTDAFGPVRVTLRRVSRQSQAQMEQMARVAPVEARPGLRRRFDAGGSRPGETVLVHIARVSVAAMETITPRMLPALISGNIDDVAKDGRETGLIGRFPRDIAVGLAGGKFVPYRHTIEPFLGFVLTRAIPNAVARRLQESVHAEIRRA